MRTRIEIYQPRETPAELDTAIKRWYRFVFPQVDENGVADDGTIYSPGRYRVLAWHDDVWSGIVEILPREIQVGEQRVDVGGVGGVMVLPEKRGLGLGKALMRRVADVICGELAFDAGLLFCDTHMLPYYAGLGWEQRQAPLTYQQSEETRKLAADTHYMVLLCSGAFPAGDVDVRGTLW